MTMDYGKRFREMSDRHKEETGEGFFVGKTPAGYYFTFGFFLNSEAEKALTLAQERRDAVPHEMVNGNRQCPTPGCISAPHAHVRHVDYTGATFTTAPNGNVTDVQGHDGE